MKKNYKHRCLENWKKWKLKVKREHKKKEEPGSNPKWRVQSEDCEVLAHVGVTKEKEEEKYQ